METPVQGERPEVPDTPVSREGILINFVIGEARDIIDAQRANIEVQTQLIETTDALREAIKVHAAELEDAVASARQELVEGYRDTAKLLRDFRTNAGEEIATPILAGVSRVVRRELSRLVLVAGVAASVGVVVGIVVGGVIARIL